MTEVKMIDWFDQHFYKVTYMNENNAEITTYIPSVTTKLGALAKPFLAKWRGDVGNKRADEIVQESQDEGTLLHWAWQCATTGGEVIFQTPRNPSYSQEQINALHEQNNGNLVVLRTQHQMWTVDRLKAWYDTVRPRDIQSELMLYDIENNDAGTADNFMYIDGGDYMINGSKPLKLETGLYVIDLKTGKSVDDTAKMQLSAYARMYEKTHDATIEGALVIHTQSSTKKGIEALSTILVDKDSIESYYQDYRDIAKVWERNFGSKKPIVRELPLSIKFDIPRKEIA